MTQKTSSSAQLRAKRIYRLAWQAKAQGGLLRVEEVSLILGDALSSIKRAIIYLKNQKLFVPTRGNYLDIGRGKSHKVQAVRLYLLGRTPTEIANWLGHSL
jgi:hypothetical protein